ncbi:MAG TPA: hypothetical protein PKC28_00450 [Bdellovibrionales bacterium]|nr:hypothetical protein [Bdellovibrionales bacterium]
MRFLIVALFAFSPGALAHVCVAALMMTEPLLDFDQFGGEVGTALREQYRARPEHPMWPDWMRAMEKSAGLREATARITGPEQKYFNRIGAGVVAALGKMQLEYVKENHLDELNVPRHREILRMIAEFDSTKPKWSLYRIKRAIEGSYDLAEYSDCLPRKVGALEKLGRTLGIVKPPPLPSMTR